MWLERIFATNMSMRYTHRSNLERQRFEFVWWVPKEDAPTFGGALVRAIDHYPTPLEHEGVEHHPGRRTMIRISRSVNGYADRVERGQTRHPELTLILCERSLRAALFAVHLGGLFVEEIENESERIIPMHVIDCGTNGARLDDGVNAGDTNPPGAALLTTGFKSTVEAQTV